MILQVAIGLAVRGSRAGHGAEGEGWGPKRAARGALAEKEHFGASTAMEDYTSCTHDTIAQNVTHAHMDTSKTGETRAGLVDSAHQCPGGESMSCLGKMSPLGNLGKVCKGASVLSLATACEATIISVKFQFKDNTSDF